MREMRKFTGMGSMLDDFFDTGFGALSPFDYVGPMKTDIKETDKSFIVECEMPGFEKSDIKVDIEDSTLIISGDTKKENEELIEKYLRKERTSCKVTRSFRFENINEDDIIAKYENGILIVEVPKAEKVARKGIDII